MPIKWIVFFSLFNLSVCLGIQVFQNTRRISANHGVCLHIFCDNRATGHNSICFTFAGAGGPSVAYKSEVLDGFRYYTDYLSYVESGNVSPWIYQQLPTGTNLGDTLQGYMADLMTKEEVLQKLDTDNEALTF